MKTFMMTLLLIVSAGLVAGQADKQTVWLDVRTAEEYAAGHLTGAINIPHTDITARIAELKLDKATPIAVYCRSGRRSGIAMEALQQLGYSNVSNQGGYEALKQQLNDDNERQ